MQIQSDAYYAISTKIKFKAKIYMSFSSDVKAEIKNKNFTQKKRHSKINQYGNKTEDRDFLIELFLEKGTMSDPEKFYHLEFVCDSEQEAVRVKDIIRGFDIQSNIMKRKEHQVVYLKDSDSISGMLTLLGAHNALLEFENVRVLKEMRENVQRRVNCETANISKTVSASMRQLEDIKYIDEAVGIRKLPKNLRDAAHLRLDFPDASLKELSERMPKVGKSGINHRFRKIAELADRLRAGETIL